MGLTKFTGDLNTIWSRYKSDVDVAFQKLEEAKTVLDEDTKVYHLLKGIKAPFLLESTTLRQFILPTLDFLHNWTILPNPHLSIVLCALWRYGIVACLDEPSLCSIVM